MKSRLLCAGLAAALPSAPLFAQRVLAETFGSQNLGRYGLSLAAIDDIDGDGVQDLVIGEPWHDYGASAGIVETGAVYLRSSRTGTIRVRQLALESFGFFGTTVAALGDVNGDGIPDFAGGAPLVNNAAGRVRVMSGRDGVELWRVEGENFSELGAGIAGVGDMNGDGRADVAVSAPQNSNRTAYSFVRFLDGTNGRTLTQNVNTFQTRWGHTLAAIPDISGDGLPDLVVGEPQADAFGQATGRVTLLDPRRLPFSMAQWQAGPSFREFERGGNRVAAVRDLNGDGRPEVLAVGETNVVHVFSGASGVLLFNLGPAVRDFGFALGDAGDFDGDGSNDFAVGAPGADNNAGRVLVYDRRGTLIAELLGEPGSRFGSSIAAIGDLDGDGRTDLAIGAPMHQRNGIFGGRVSIHGYRVPATAELFGAGCASGVTVPNLYPAGTPALGERFEARCDSIPRQAFGFWMLGVSSTQASFGALPFDLSPLGYQGCAFLVSQELVVGFPAGNESYVTLDLSVPNLPSLLAAHAYVQAGFLDPSQSAPLRLSRGLACQIGHP